MALLSTGLFATCEAIYWALVSLPLLDAIFGTGIFADFEAIFVTGSFAAFESICSTGMFANGSNIRHRYICRF